MSRLTITSEVQALGACEHLIVIARKGTLDANWLSAGLPEGIGQWISRVGQDASPGRLGSPASTLLSLDGGPNKLTVVALHDAVTHHVSEARTEEIWQQLRGVARGAKGSVGVVVGLAAADQAFGAAMGVSRCFSLYSRKTKNTNDADIQVLLRHADGDISDVAPLQVAADSQRLIQRLVDIGKEI